MANAIDVRASNAPRDWPCQNAPTSPPSSSSAPARSSSVRRAPKRTDIRSSSSAHRHRRRASSIIRAQACKALKEEGYRIVLVNSNPATIMTDPDWPTRPISSRSRPIVAKIIEKERPDAVLPTMGGQTALNTALALFNDGTLEKYGCR
jgi:hypothetical protein